jgi:SHS2 domain-containing protein
MLILKSVITTVDEIRAVEKVTAELETADAFKLTFPFFDVDELSVQEYVITTSKAKINVFFIMSLSICS